MQEKVLYISDLDGTLLADGAVLSERSAELLNRCIEQGVMFTAATARTWASAGHILSKLEMKTPVILQNGVLIYSHKEKRYLHKAVMSRELSRKIYDAFIRHELYPFVYTITDNELCSWYFRFTNSIMENFYNERRTLYYKKFTQFSDFSQIDGEIIYFTIQESHEKLKAVYDELKEISELSAAFYKDIYNEGYWFLEVFSSEASKKLAAQKLKKLTGAEIIYAFGDNLNDLPLFEAADVKIAVENGAEETKKAADIIIADHNKDSVAEYIYSRVFGNEEGEDR